MILNALVNPTKFARAFQQWTRVSFQVRTGNTFFLSSNMGEAQNQNDGLQLNQANTNPPYDTWIKGDLWYSADADNSSLRMVIWGVADEHYHP